MANGIQINEGDFVFTNRKLLTVTGKEKALRDLRKMLLTESEFPENQTTYRRYNPYYGTELGRSTLYKGLARDQIIDLMNNKLNDGLQRYVILQESRVNLSLGEIITSLDFFFYNDAFDHTKIRFSLTGAIGTEASVNIGEYSQTL